MRKQSSPRVLNDMIRKEIQRRSGNAQVAVSAYPTVMSSAVPMTTPVVETETDPIFAAAEAALLAAGDAAKLAAIDQALATTSNVTHAKLTLTAASPDYSPLSITGAENAGNGISAVISNADASQGSLAVLKLKSGINVVGGVNGSNQANYQYGYVNGLTLSAYTSTGEIGFRVNNGAFTGVGVPAMIIKANGYVGINNSVPSYQLDVSGPIRTSSYLRLGVSTRPGNAADATPRDWGENYVQSRGQNLVSNGSGFLNNNFNFSPFTFDAIERHGGGGSFLLNVASQTKFTDEYIPIDPEKYYRLMAWGRSGDSNGANYNAANRQYFGIAAYDADKNIIAPQHAGKYSGSSDTTLAVALNPGDTTVTLVDASGWYNGVLANSRQFAWWPYSNALGYCYPNYSYSRNLSRDYSGNSTSGTWSTNGINGNIITLRVPWAGPALPLGTPVRNNPDGNAYQQIVLSNVSVPNVWTHYEGYIGPAAGDGILRTNEFRAGAVFARLEFIVNSGGIADNNVRWSDLCFTELSSRNMEIATATVPGVLSITAQSIAGDKTFTGVVQAAGYKASDGTAGVSDSAAGIPTALSTKNGLVTAITKTAGVSNGSYTVGARITPGGEDGKITISNGIITAITQAT